MNKILEEMKTAIITGGGHGIGKSIVKRLLADQIRVIAFTG